MKLFQGPQRSLTSKDFVPQGTVHMCVCVRACVRVHPGDSISSGAVAVVTSMECLDWLEDLLNKLWVPGGNIKPHYRGMPLVILAVDECIKEGMSIISVAWVQD